MAMNGKADKTNVTTILVLVPVTDKTNVTTILVLVPVTSVFFT